jgi:hypothetical protein
MSRKSDAVEPEAGRSQGQRKAIIRLALGRGHVYEIMVFGLAGMLFMEAFIFATGGRGWNLVPMPILASLFLLGLLYYRDERVLEADERGVRLFRGPKVQTDLPWEEVARVCHGPQQLHSWVFVPHDGYILLVQGPRRWRRIYVDSVSYKVSPKDLAEAGHTIESLARARFVPIQVYPFGEVRQSRLAAHLFGPTRNTAAAGAAIVVAVLLVLAIWGAARWGPMPALLAWALFFGLLLLFFAYRAIATRRFFCPRCDGHQVFERREGEFRCVMCGHSPIVTENRGSGENG